MVDLELEPSPVSVAIMDHIDSMRPAMRALVREFGYVIVRDMLADGYSNARELRGLLEVWRQRRQDEWLATDFHFHFRPWRE